MARKTYKYASNEVSNFKIFSSPEGPGRGPTCLDSIKTRGYTVKKLTLFFKKLKICAGLRGIRKSALGFHKEQLKFERTKKKIQISPIWWHTVKFTVWHHTVNTVITSSDTRSLHTVKFSIWHHTVNTVITSSGTCSLHHTVKFTVWLHTVKGGENNTK